MRAIAALTICIASAPAAAAQELRVDALLGEHQRPGRFVPVAIEVRAGAVPLRSSVELAVEGGPSARLPVDLPANGRLHRVVPVTLQGAVARVTVRAAWAAVDDEPAAVLRLRRPSPDTALVLALAAGDAEARTFALLGDGRRRILGLRPAHVPQRAELLEILDCAVLGAVAGDALGDERAGALAEWVLRGGTVLLTDPDLLRREPELDRRLFPPRGAEESLPPAIAGLPGHFAQALRRRGLGPRNVVYDADGAPHHIRFAAGDGHGALLLQPLDAAAGRTAMTRLWNELAVPAGLPAPTLAPGVLAAFPPAAPGGWPRPLLALWLLLVPLAGWVWHRRRRAGVLVAAGAAGIAAWLGVASTAPTAQVVTLERLGASPGSEQVVHVASARGARLELELAGGALPRPLARRAGELTAGLGVVEWGDAPRWREFAVARGSARTAALTPAGRPTTRLLGVQAGSRLLVSNESGVAIGTCLLAWRGRLWDLGAFSVGEVRSVPLPERLAGPLEVLEQVGERDGIAVARALRVARARAATGERPLLLAAVDAAVRAAPVLHGASTTGLPSVLIAPVATDR